MVGFLLKIIKFIGVFFIFIYGLIWLITPNVSRFFSEDVLSLLAQNHLSLSEQTTIRYNPFLSRLSIYDFVLYQKGSEEAVLKINELQLELSLYKLVVDQLQISEFEISGLFVKIKIANNNIEVAGISLNQQNTDEEELVEEIESSLILQMAQFNLTNSMFELDYNGNVHSLQLDNVTIERVIASTKNQKVAVIIEGAFDQAPIKISANAQINNRSGNLVSYTSIEDLDVSRFKAFLPEAYQTLIGKISFKGEQQIDFSPEKTTALIKQAHLTINQLALRQNNIQLSILKQSLVSDKITITHLKNQPLNVTAQANLYLKDLLVTQDNEKLVILQFEELNVTDIAAEYTEENETLSIAEINLSQLVFSNDTRNAEPPLAQFLTLNINQLAATPKNLAVNTITLSGLGIEVQLDADKAISNLILPSTDQKIEPPNAAIIQQNDGTPPSVEQPQFSVLLNQFSLKDIGHINFLDRSVLPVYQRHFIVDSFALGPINSDSPQTKTLFKLIGKSEEYSHFQFSGFSQPYLEQPIHHLNASFKEVSLPAVSSYMKEALDYVFDSGQLDLALKTTLTGDNIDGNMSIFMRGLELSEADESDTAHIDKDSDHSAIPFSVALSILKDSKGNVELDIPLSGNINSPSFGLGGLASLIVTQASLIAAQEYLMKTFIPYGNVVSLAMSAGNYLLKIRFNDIEYPATETDLQPEHQQFLAEFSALLKEKSEENITICAISTPADIGKPDGSIIDNKADIKELKAIASARMNAFKTFMVKTKNLASARILICTPKIDNAAGAKPRMTFTN